MRTGTNGEVLVEVPLFYVSGMLDVNPRVSAVPMPGFRAPRKFRNADGSLKQKCYLPAFPGSIGADGKLHSIAGVVSTGSRTISQFLAAARLWGETYCINTSADFEVLAYLMIVVYGTRNVQSKINGCVSLYATNIAVAGALTDEAAVTVAKGVLEVGNVISIGTGSEDASVASQRIVTAIEAIDGDTANVKASFSGDPVTTTIDHKVWRIMQSTGAANSVISTCGSPVSNTDGKHSFVFYGVENPLYGNQWRFECDWKLIDGVPYYCDDPTKYQWSSADDYTKLDGLTLPGDGWARNLQADERFPWLQITKESAAAARPIWQTISISTRAAPVSFCAVRTPETVTARARSASTSSATLRGSGGTVRRTFLSPVKRGAGQQGPRNCTTLTLSGTG